MRHAQQRAGHLTNAGSAHVRELAGRLSEWVRAEWRNEPDRAIRVWYTAPATEVRETVDLLMQEVLAETQRPELRKQPKLKPNQAKHLLELHDSGNYTQAELEELFSVGRSTIYRTIERMRPKPAELERPFAHVLPPFPNTETSTPPFRAKG
jgi:hypothetical protein